jgi:flagellar assembly factor FliW
MILIALITMGSQHFAIQEILLLLFGPYCFHRHYEFTIGNVVSNALEF